jgi:hypothetical protein
MARSLDGSWVAAENSAWVAERLVELVDGAKSEAVQQSAALSILVDGDSD